MWHVARRACSVSRCNNVWLCAVACVQTGAPAYLSFLLKGTPTLVGRRRPCLSWRPVVHLAFLLGVCLTSPSPRWEGPSDPVRSAAPSPRLLPSDHRVEVGWVFDRHTCQYTDTVQLLPPKKTFQGRFFNAFVPTGESEILPKLKGNKIAEKQEKRSYIQHFYRRTAVFDR